MSDMDIQGGCLCGKIRYRLIAAPYTPPYYCHCDTCRKATGGPTVVWLAVKSPFFSFTQGEPIQYTCRRCARRGTYNAGLSCFTRQLPSHGWRRSP